jgi:hypothetical protein
MTLELFAQIIAAILGLSFVGVGLLMAHDMGTDYARFQRVDQRREARKERRAARAD